MTPQELGAKMREIRLSQNFTRRKLGKLLNISQRTLRYYEDGHCYPLIEFLQEFEHIFSLPEMSLAQYGRQLHNKTALAKLRLQCGLTQEQVAKMFHISTSILSAIEHGKTHFIPEIQVIIPQIEKYLRNLALVKKEKGDKP